MKWRPRKRMRSVWRPRWVPCLLRSPRLRVLSSERASRANENSTRSEPVVERMRIQLGVSKCELPIQSPAPAPRCHTGSVRSSWIIGRSVQCGGNASEE
eukprot:135208-Rhodomonas_salina.1